MAFRHSLHPGSRVVALNVAAVFLLLGCPVDERELAVAPDAAGGNITIGGRTAGSGGVPRGGSAGAGGAPSEPPAGGSLGLGDAGSAGDANAGGGDAAPTTPPVIDGCVDLDENGVADCQETLADNADFKVDTANWSADLDGVIRWTAQNSYGATPSGSAAVAGVGVLEQDGLGQTASKQCVPVPEGSNSLVALASFFIKPGQGEGLAGVSVFFFEDANCSGSPNGPLSAARGDTDAWTTLQANGPVPVTAASMLVRLTVTKPFRSASFEVLFDNVLIRGQ